MSDSRLYPLTADVLDMQLSAVELLVAMFPDTKELDISSADLELIQSIKDNHGTVSVPPEIPLALHVSLDETHSIQVNVSVSLRSSKPDPVEPPPIQFSIRQPTWLGRTEATSLASQLPEDIFSALDVLREEGIKFVPSTASEPIKDSVPSGPLTRVWFYFPSLSTRSKRDDMVKWAPSHQLTGFVLAGKPGMLCLEGAAASVDAYMNEIKTVSWSDIPSYQKKVSERYRETISERAFKGMQEITDLLGERHGQRQNRGDMAALEGWLKERGLGDAFDGVILSA